MKLSHWPSCERPREKLLAEGEKNLSNSELIAILFGVGAPGKTALDLARELLAQSKDLRKIAQTSFQEFRHLRGFGKAKYVLLKAALELGKRASTEVLRCGSELSSSLATENFLALRLRDQKQEIFSCLFLNTRNQVLAYEELFRGSLREATIYPREVVQRGLYHNAAKIILAHNHPSGFALPSTADKELTKRLQETLALVDIQVVDHVIVGGEENFSFAERGLL